MTASAASPAMFTRIKDHLRAGLAEGRWTPGDLMPSEAELVAEFGVSRMTVNRALRELRAEGLVERVQGVGTFAARLNRLTATLLIRDMREHIASLGLRYRLDCHFVRKAKAPADPARALGLMVGAPVFHSRVVYHGDGIALQYEDRFVNPAAAPDYLAVDFQEITPTQYLLDVAPTWEAFYRIEARVPAHVEAQALGIGPAEPCLAITRWTVSRAVPVTYVILVHPGKRYRLEGAFEP